MIFFSPSTLGFYTREIHADAMPADVVAITPARHLQLLEGQAAGATIVMGKHGPSLARPKISLAHNRAAALLAVKREARRRILAIAPYWRQLNDLNTIASCAIGQFDGPAGRAKIEAAVGRRREIDQLRAASDRLEARVAAMSAEQLAGFNPGDDLNWSDAA